MFYISLDQSSQRATISGQEIDNLEKEVAQTKEEISQLETDLKIAQHPIAVEKVIRNQLLMQKENEYVFQLPPVEIIENPPQVEEQLTPWQEWQQVLFE